MRSTRSSRRTTRPCSSCASAASRGSEVPVLRPDGSVFARPGYDLATRLVYRPPAGLLVPDIPDDPTDAERADALEALLDVIRDFPFVDAASRANTLALLLTPLLRPA